MTTHNLGEHLMPNEPAAPREYGFAVSIRGTNPLPAHVHDATMASLQMNYKRWRREIPELPEWSDEFIRFMDPTPARKVLPCEHGADEEGDPLLDDCPEYGDDCEGYTLGDVIEGQFEHHIAWYVNLDEVSS